MKFKFMRTWIIGFQPESNRRPRDWQSLALTNWATLAREVLYIHLHMHIYVYVYICIYIYTYIYIYKHIYVYIYINIHTSVGVCVCVCVCVYYDINRRKTWRAPYPHNQIYSRFWYAFSLFLRKFHSVNPFNGNFCELGRAGSLRKRLNFHLRLSAKRTLL